MILEYKLERTVQGLKTPEWVEDGGYFRKGKTFIGWSLGEAYREYYIPDTAVELTPTELIKRVKTLGMKGEDGKALTNTEIEAVVNDWVQARTDHNVVLLKAARILYGYCSQDPIDDTIYVNGVALTPKQLGQVTAKAAELEVQEKTDSAYKRLQELCDAKSQEAKDFINGARVTVEQLARYEEKYEIAKDCKSSIDKLEPYSDIFKLEADLAGITEIALIDLIISKGNAYRHSLSLFNAKIEAFRVKTKSLIASGQVDKASRIIETARGFDITTTDADVRGVFV